jgi:hypothetical protein
MVRVDVEEIEMYHVTPQPSPHPIHLAVGSPTAAGPPDSSPVESSSSEVSDDTTIHPLDNFINKVTRKRDSPLIREPPKQPPAKPLVPRQSRRLAAQLLSRVPTSK